MSQRHPIIGDQRALAILSPASGRLLDQFAGQLKIPFPSLELLVPDNLEHLTQTVQASADKYSLLIAIGGDGTFYQVLRSADLHRQSFAVLAAGTGNDFARSIGCPSSIDEIAGWLMRSRPQPTDLGLVNGLRFHNSAGIGIDTATLKLRLDHNNLLTRNYTLAFIMALRRLQAMDCRLTFDDRTISDRFYWLLAMNTRDIGGGTRIAPRAEIDDGLLDFMLVNKCSKPALLGMLPAAIHGQHLDKPMVTYLQQETAELAFTQPQPYLALDGELERVDSAKLRFECIRGGMMILR